MAIRSIEKNGIKGYLVKVAVRGHYDKSVQVKRQAELLSGTMAEAKKLERQLLEEAKNQIARRELGGITLRKLLDRWHSECLKGNPITGGMSGINHFHTVERHAKQLLGLPLRDIRSNHIEAVFSKMIQQGLSVSRIKCFRGAFNVIFDWGLREGLIPRGIESAARGIKLPKDKKQKEQPILTRDEILKFLASARTANHEYYYLWALALQTGMRSGELWELKWDDIDLNGDDRLINVSRSFEWRTGQSKSTKSGWTRQIPINAELEVFLKELKLRTFATGWVLPRITSWRRGEAAKVTRKLSQDIGVREITFHATRACWCIQMLKIQDVPTVMRIGGWHSIKAFQCYVRLSGTEIRGATDRLSLLPPIATGQLLVPSFGA